MAAVRAMDEDDDDDNASVSEEEAAAAAAEKEAVVVAATNTIFDACLVAAAEAPKTPLVATYMQLEILRGLQASIEVSSSLFFRSCNGIN